MGNKLVWPFGNRVKIVFPLQKVTMTSEGKETSDFIPSDGAEVSVVFSNALRKLSFTPEVDGNRLLIDNNGTLPVGEYDITVLVTEVDGTRYRSHWENVVEIVHSSAPVMDMYDDFPDYAEGAVVEAPAFFFAKGDKGDKGDDGKDGVTDYNQLENKPDLSLYMTVSGFDEFIARQFSGVASTLDAHTGDKVIHISQEERDAWNAKPNAGYAYSKDEADGKFASIMELADYATTSSVYYALQSKQDRLTAGNGISITDSNVISVNHQDLSHKQDRVSIVDASGATLNAEANKYYIFSGIVNTLNVILPSIDSSFIHSLVLSFTTGSTPAVTISSSDNLPIAYFDGYSIEADTTYELNIMYNGSKWIVAYAVVE